MALTRPKIWDIDTNVTFFTDSITVMNQGASSASTDVGFLFNRAHGLVANVALYWSEAEKSFITAFTSNSGTTNSNISVTSYANITVGSVLTLNGAGLYLSPGSGFSLNGSFGAANQVLTATGTGGVQWSPPGAFTGGYVSGSTVFGSNLVANSTTASSSTTTGALVVVGGAGIAGNLYVSGNIVSNSTGSITVPVGTTSERPGLAVQGMVRYNTTISSFEGFGAGAAWSSLGGVKSVDGYAYISAEASAGAGDDVLRFYSGSTGSSAQVMWASGSNVSILPTTTSTSTTTGALQVAGGIGVVGNINIGNQLNFDVINGNIAITSGAPVINQSAQAIAIGQSAGETSQGEGAISIGLESGKTSQGNYSVALGAGAGIDTQGLSSVALGESSGSYIQGLYAVAIGSTAGNYGQGNYAVAVGSEAANTSQATNAVAIGRKAGQTSQGGGAVAIGASAGNNSQGDYSVAIGAYAGQTSQSPYSIVLNATASGLNPANQGFYVSPIRSDSIAWTPLVYDATTKEITAASGNIVVASSSDSTSTTTGALVVSGGAGIAGNLYVGGNLVINGTTTTINNTTVETIEYVQTTYAGNIYAATIGNTGAALVGNTLSINNIIGNVSLDGNIYVSANGYINGSRIIVASDLETVTTTPTFITNDPTSQVGLAAIAGTSTTYGGYQFGNVQSVSILNDYNVSTSYGFYSINDAATTPGYVVYCGFTGVTGFTRLVMNLNYTAASGHTIDIDLYNFTTSTWDTLTTYSGTVNWVQFMLEVIDSTAYISAGKVYSRLYHVNFGNASLPHNTKIDYWALQDSLQGGQGPRGATGATGPTGATGATGNGLVAGGTTGQTLVKNSNTDYDTVWVSNLTLSNLSVSTTVTASTLSAATIGNVSSAHIGATGRFDTSVTTNTLNAATIGNSGATLTGTLSTAAQTNVTSLGTLTGLTVSGTTQLTNSTNNNGVQYNSGALQVTGGVGIGGNLYVGGNLSVAGNTTVVNTTINNSVTGNLLVGAALNFAATGANIQYGGNQNGYLQMNMQNLSSGSNASTDYVATADNGNDSVNYIDLGINSSTYSQTGYSANYPNDGYVMVQGNGTNVGGNLILATMTARDIVFTTNGQNSDNIVARITSGNVLTVVNTQAATSTTTGAFRVAGGAGIAGNVVADQVWATNNGNGTNFKIGDDTYLGDINVANTTRLMGLQDATQAYIVFGNSNASNYIGRSGTNPITVTGAFAVTGNTAVTNTIYGQGLYDNANRVVSTSTGAGNLTISGTAINLSAAGPGAATTGSGSAIPVITTDAYGRISAISTSALTAITNLSSSGAGNITVSAATGSSTLSLPATGPGAASVGSSTAIPVITTDAYGRVAATSTAAVVAPAGTLTGTTLASGVVSSSLTSVGRLTGLTVDGTITATTLNAGTIGNASATLTGGQGSISGGFSVGTLVATNFSTGNAVVTGGYSDNHPIGANTKATGAFTTLTATGNVDLQNTVYGRGIYDNANRVVSTSTGLGNLTISASTIYLTATGPGAASVGSSTAIPVITTDAYGRVAGTTTAAVVAPAGTLTGTTLASGVVSSSLTSLGVITSLSATTAVVTNFSSGNIIGTFNGTLSSSITAATANVSMYDNVTALTTNQTFYPQFSNTSATGNTIMGVSGALTFNPGVGSGTLVTGTVNAGTIGNASAALTGGTVNISGAGFIGTSVATNFSTGNAVITNGVITTGVITNFSTGNARISGGYADNFAIGGNTKSSGAFTTLTATSNIVAASGTASTNTTSGAVVVTGGIGVSGGINMATGQYLDLSNGGGTRIARDGGINGLRLDTGSTIRVFVADSGNVAITSTTTSTSTTTGALVVAGGAGIAGNVYVGGSLYAISKSFLIPHPTKPGKQLRYGSLEGPENGVYVRGRLTGSNTIELPEYWIKLVDPDSITVNLTPIGRHQNLYVVEADNTQVVVGNSNLISKGIDCYYTVYGERCDVDKLGVEID